MSLIDWQGTLEDMIGCGVKGSQPLQSTEEWRNLARQERESRMAWEWVARHAIEPRELDRLLTRYEERKSP